MKKFLLIVSLILAMSPLITFALQEEADTSADGCAQISVNLRYGARDNLSNNNAVSMLQDFLISNGYLKATVSGFFGSMTRSAVSAFQLANNITPAAGFVGAVTRARIQDIDCNGASSVTQPTQSTTTYWPNSVIPTKVVAPTTTKPYITSTGAKAAGNLEIYIGEGADVYGVNLGNVTKVSIGGVPANILSKSNNMVVIKVPTSLSKGTYDLYVSDYYGQSNVLKVSLIVPNSTPAANTVSPSQQCSNQIVGYNWIGQPQYQQVCQPTQAPANIPSIHLTATSNGLSNDTLITVNQGNTVTVSGTPMNLSGVRSRAYFFDQTWGNNSMCGNNSSDDLVWTFTCTASVGSTYVYVEIYQNGKVYKSNTININVLPSTQISNTPVITSINPTSGPSGTVVTINGSGFTGSGVVFNGYPDSPLPNLNLITPTTAKFTVPINWPIGSNSLWVETIGVSGQSSAYFTVTPSTNTSKADLTPSPIIYNSADLVVGKQVFFNPGIANNGEIATDSFNVKWFVDGVQVGYGSHDGIGANKIIYDGNSKYTWTATAGSHAIEFKVDADNHIDESDETNNSKIITVNVPNVGAATNSNVASVLSSMSVDDLIKLIKVLTGQN